MSSKGIDRRGLRVIDGGKDNDDTRPRQILPFPNQICLATGSKAMDVLEGFIAPELYNQALAYACEQVGSEETARALLDVILEDLKGEGFSCDGPDAFENLSKAIDALTEEDDEDEEE